MSEQLYELARPFPEGLIRQKPGKFAASYVEHSVVSQRLLEVVGPYDFCRGTHRDESGWRGGWLHGNAVLRD